MKCFICKENINATIFKCCDRACCSKVCQVFLVKLNLHVDPNLKYPELWVKSYNEDESNANNIFGNKVEDKDEDEDGIELNISDPNKKKRRMEKETSIIIYKRSLFCCSH